MQAPQSSRQKRKTQQAMTLLRRKSQSLFRRPTPHAPDWITADIARISEGPEYRRGGGESKLGLQAH
ncbi:hypothetical protein N7474_002328 [Penicillium riverlandense]|uniref:uncharacterized protein n=1 Tax=Penicillium riverlandense TaxID=1903569 RepID=UPI0025490A0F|nr:uncharacterized protein N7474_002328 [Penicillium riverlandense]KAJ5825190.1 hypothetical protein N7474_002328 [Penicillium riverlandense]